MSQYKCSKIANRDLKTSKKYTLEYLVKNFDARQRLKLSRLKRSALSAGKSFHIFAAGLGSYPTMIVKIGSDVFRNLGVPGQNIQAGPSPFLPLSFLSHSL